MTTGTKNNPGSQSEDDLKTQASKIISNFFGHTEKFVHEVIDKGSKLAGSAEDKIRQAYDGLVDLLSQLSEKDPDDLKYGDLVISPVDLNNEIKAGDVFEYNKDTAPLINPKFGLLVPGQKQLVNYSKIKELEELKFHISQNQQLFPLGFQELNSLFNQRIAGVKEQKVK